MNFNAIFLEETVAPQGGGAMQWVFILAIIVVFYFFMIRPQQQQQKKLAQERNNMKKGDNVITSGGIYGKIDGVITTADKKGNQVVDSFIIAVKPNYEYKMQVSKECVFKDLADVAAQQAQK